jgi:excisionase family DNA binding protein
VKMNESFKAKVEDMLISELIAGMKKEGQLKLTFTVPEVAKILGINKIKMYELARSNSFPKIEIGNRILVPILPFIEWIEITAWSKAS